MTKFFSLVRTLFIIVAAILIAVAGVKAATTIGDNIATDGTISANNYLGTWDGLTTTTLPYIGSGLMTDLGDIIYGGVNGVATRLAGNISTNKMFLSQMGTGATSSIPVWSSTPLVGGNTYYLLDASSSVNHFKEMTGAPTTVKNTLSYATLANGTTTLIKWVTDAGSPDLSFIAAGIYEFHIHAFKTAGGNNHNVRLYAEIWEVDASGNDIAKIGNTELGPNIANDVEREYTMDFADANVYNLADATSRVAIKVVGSISGTGTNPSIQLYYGGEADSHLAFPENTFDTTNFLTTSLLHGYILAGNSANIAAATSTIFIKNGNVGIGTINPGNTFEVSDLFKIDDTLENESIGRSNLAANTSGNKNISIGLQALWHNDTGSANVAIGPSALAYNISGDYNIAIGVGSLFSNSSAAANVSIGRNTMFNNDTGTHNTAVGTESMVDNVGGGLNTAFGDHTLQLNISGSSNTAIGDESLQNTIGGFNTALGEYSGYSNTSGTYNIFVGSGAGSSTKQKIDATNSMALGANSYFTASNEYVYGTSTVQYHIFPGGNVGIGTSTPASTLDVNGSIRALGGSAGHATCWKADGKTIGYCSTVVAADGTCTCN